MPIKWDPAQDQRLLLKILETHPDLKLNVDAVADAWPVGDGEAKPTPRAIRERLVKIRETHKKSGSGGHFSIGKTRGKPKTAAAANGVNPTARAKPTPVTPRKRKGDAVIKTENGVQSPSINNGSISPGGAYPTPSSSFSQTIPAPSFHHSTAPSFTTSPSGHAKRRTMNDEDDSSASGVDDASYTRTERIVTRGKRVQVPVYQSDGNEPEDSEDEWYPNDP